MVSLRQTLVGLVFVLATAPAAAQQARAAASGGAFGLPVLKPPYGRITAIDLNTATQSWMVARVIPSWRHSDRGCGLR